MKRTKPETKTNKAAMYIRTSTTEQNCDNQRHALEQMAAARGLDVVHVFEEQISATKRRPSYEAMMEAAHAGEFTTLLVWALDRLGRSMVGNTQAVLTLDSLGVRVVSAKESWLDMQGPVRTLLLGVFGWISEAELLRLRERTVAGLERARRQGKRLGRPRAHVEVAYVQHLRRQGQSMDAIAKKVGVSRATLFRLMGAVSNTGAAEA